MKNPIKPLTADMNPVRRNTADFVQFTRGYLSDIGKLTAKNPTATRILMFLTERMTKQNAVVISQNTLAEILKVTKPTINNAIKTLRNDNWVQIVRIGTSNGYLVNSRVAWRDFSNSPSRFAIFNAEVIASEAEQKQTVEELENQPLKNIPNVKAGEITISGNEELPPPDQRELFEPDFETVPHLKD